jgi:glycosyltransferase involved in cell wall biosynthesis
MGKAEAAMTAIQNPKSKIQNGLRILCLNYEYPPVGGGGGRIAHRINTELVRRGHAVRVQTAGLKHLSAHEVVEDVEVFRTESFRKKEDTCTVPEMALYLLTSFLPTLRHIRKWNPHVIHVHFAVPTGALACTASLFTGMPYVLTAHLGDVPGGVPEQTAGLFRLVQPFTRPIWSRAAAITAVSTFVADLAERAYGRRPEVVLNGMPLGPRPSIAIHSPPRFVLVGRLSLQKNPVLAIRALALVQNLPWVCEIIGDGPLRAEMEREARGAGIESRVQFRGWLGAADVAAAMSGADALLITSHSEGLPMAAIEALDRGLAIVSSRIGGVADVVEDGRNGFLCELTPESFSTALRAILSDPEKLRAKREASSAMAEHFDLSRSVDAYERLLTAHSRPG